VSAQDALPRLVHGKEEGGLLADAEAVPETVAAAAAGEVVPAANCGVTRTAVGEVPDAHSGGTRMALGVVNEGTVPVG